jgi:hypothetical protein
VDPDPIFFTLLLPFTFTRSVYILAYYYLLPLDTLNPLFTANRWDWQPHRKLGTKFLVVLCAGSTLLLVKSFTPTVSSGAAVRSVAKLARITFWSLTFSYWFDKPWFHNWAKLAAVLLIPSSWGSQLGALTPHHQAFFWRRCRGERIFLQGESLTLNLLLCFYFALSYFYLHRFIKKIQKKLVPL